MTRLDDPRFTQPLYTIGEAAAYLGVPPSTMGTWVHGYVRRPPGRAEVRGEALLTALPRPKGPEIPFVGLAEGMVVAAFRRAGVSMQHVRRALLRLAKEIGIEHALASRQLYTDGARVLYNYAYQDTEDARELTVVVTQQRVFTPVVEAYLARITYDEAGWAERLVLPFTERHIVQADPRRAFGQPIFLRGAARLEDVVDRFIAGDPIAEVAADFGVPAEDVEDVIRAILRPAA